MQNPRSCFGRDCVFRLDERSDGPRVSAGCRCVPSMDPQAEAHLREAIRWMASEIARLDADVVQLQTANRRLTAILGVP